jgi:hypothetical protein
MSTFRKAELTNCQFQGPIMPLVLSLNMPAAEFVSLFVIKLKTTGSIFVKMRRANLMLVVLTEVVVWRCRTVCKRLVVIGYKRR